MSVNDIRNFQQVGDKLLTGGMPTAGQLEDVQRAGVKAVINLAIPEAPQALPDEAAIVASLGMQYIGIPVQWEHPTRQDLEQFMNAMDAHGGDRLFVHCQANYRASAFIMLHRVLRLGWDQGKALEDVRRIWNPDDYPVWKRFIDENLA